MSSLLTVSTSPATVARLLDAIRPGSMVTIITPHGSQLRGRCVMKFTSHAVLNLGARHGTPGIATDANTVRVS